MPSLLRRPFAWWMSAPPPEGATLPEARHFGIALVGSPMTVVVHLILLSTFAALGVWPMVFFNIGSVFCWVGVAIACRAGALRFGLGLGVIEVIAHAVVATNVLGWASGFHLFPLTVAILLANAPDRAFGLGQLVAQFGSWAALFVLMPHMHEPWSPVDANLTVALNAANHLIAFASIGVVMRSVLQLANTKEAELAAEHAESERLLHNILPVEIAERLKRGEEVIADGFDEASVLFSDIVGFTTMSEKIAPDALVCLLNDVFSAVDDLVVEHGLEKIKTIGDAYMIAAGLPLPRADHAEALARFSLAMLRVIDGFEFETGQPLQMRIGIHSGPVVAGVIGKRKFAYDLWGDTVNTAARMESHGLPGRVHISEATRSLLGPQFGVEGRGTMTIKGKGDMATFLLVDG